MLLPNPALKSFLQNTEEPKFPKRKQMCKRNVSKYFTENYKYSLQWEFNWMQILKRERSMKITMGYVIPGPVRCLQILSNHLAVRFVVHLCPYSQGGCFGDIIHSL